MDRLDTLAVFVAVAENESFSVAARRLNRSATAVTRAIATLEDRMQVRLLNRSTRALSLTEAGARALESARRLLAGLEEFDAIAGDTGTLRGSIGVTAPTMFGRMHVLPLVQSFLLAHPELSVRLMLLDRVVSLVDEGLDLAVRIGALPDSSLRALRVGTVQESIYASPDYLAARGTPVTPRDLIGHRIIACTTITPIPDRWSFVEIGPVPVQPCLVVNTTEAAVEAAASGLGIAFIVSYQAEPHLAAGRLARILSDFEPPPEPVHLVHPAGRHQPARVRLLLDHLADGLRLGFGAAPRASPQGRRSRRR